MAVEYGVTPQGFLRKPYEVIDQEIRTYLQSTISSTLVLDATDPLGAFHTVTVDAISELWEIAEHGYHGIDLGKALGQQIVSLGKLIGRYREGEDYGYVTMTLTNKWPDGYIIPPGSILVNVYGAAENAWTNRDTIVKTNAAIVGGAIVETDLTAVFRSTSKGPQAYAAAGLITKLTSNFEGLTSVINLQDSTRGRYEETFEELRQALYGANTLGDFKEASIKKAVEQVPGVISANVRVNRLDILWFGIPPRSIEVTVWDGSPSQANNVDIVNAIARHITSGDSTVGEYSGYVETGSSEPAEIRFKRSEIVPATVVAVVRGAVSTQAVIESILSKQPGQGEALSRSQLIAACINAGGSDVPSLTLSINSTSVEVAQAQANQRIDLDTSRITVTIV